MIESNNKGTLLQVQVKPRSKKQTIIFEGKSSCIIHVKAAPTRGQANNEVLKLLAKKLGISTYRIRIISGEKTATKKILIEGMDQQSVVDSLTQL